jgi:hypothetical protein
MKYLSILLLQALALSAWAKDQTKFAPIDVATIDHVKIEGRNCPESFLEKPEELRLIDALADSKFMGADKFKWDYTLTISLKDKRERVFLIKADKFQESGKWKTWLLNKKDTFTSICSPRFSN